MEYYPIVLMVIFLGFAATAAFLGLGISSARSASQEAFEQSAAVLIQQVEIAWKDYEVAALWTHQACTSHEDFAHQEFRELYEHLASTGIDAQIEWVPKVAHAQRQEMERQSREYYAKEYPGVVDYKGFVGIEPIVVDNVTSGETGLLPRSDADFYYPIHFIEPLGSSGSAIDLDVYTRGSAKLSIDKAMETWKPTLSEPFKLVEETVDHASAVFLMHPGTPLSTQPDLRPKDLALLVIRIPDLVRRATMTQATPTSVFLYDTTDSGEEEQNELFLGGVVLNGGDDDSSCKLLPPTSLRKIRSDSRLIRERVAPIADREWTIAVVAFPDTYETQTAFVIIGATLLFICSLCTAAWIFSNIRYSIMKREAKLKEIQAAAESEKAALVLENATRAAQAERTLNDFIA